MSKSLRAAVASIALYAALISGLKYLTGAGRSPVKTSLAWWYSARATARSGLTLPRNRRLRIIARAWAIIATRRVCSWMFSGYVLCINPQRLMNLILERYAKKWLTLVSMSRGVRPVHPRAERPDALLANAPDVIGAKSLHILLASRPRLQKLPMNPILVFADLLHCDRLFVKKPPDWFSSCGHSSDIDPSAIGSEVAMCLRDRLHPVVPQHVSNPWRVALV